MINEKLRKSLANRNVNEILIWISSKPVMSQCYPVKIYRGISAPGNGIEVVDGLNAVD